MADVRLYADGQERIEALERALEAACKTCTTIMEQRDEAREELKTMRAAVIVLERERDELKRERDEPLAGVAELDKAIARLCANET